MSVMKLQTVRADPAPLREQVQRAAHELGGPLRLQALRGENIEPETHQRALDTLIQSCADHIAALIFPYHAEVLCGDVHAYTQASGAIHGVTAQWEAPRALGAWCAEDLAVYAGLSDLLNPLGNVNSNIKPQARAVMIQPVPDSPPEHHALWSRTFGQSGPVGMVESEAAKMKWLAQTRDGTVSDETRLAMAVQGLLAHEPLADIYGCSMLRAACAWTGQGFSAAQAMFMPEQPAAPGSLSAGYQTINQLSTWAQLGGSALLSVMTQNLNLTWTPAPGNQSAKPLSMSALLGLQVGKGTSTPQADVIKAALQSLNSLGNNLRTHLLNTEGPAHAPIWQITQARHVKGEQTLTLLNPDAVSLAGPLLTLARDLAHGFIEPLMPRSQALSEASGGHLKTYSSLGWTFGTLFAPLQARTTLKAARARSVDEMIKAWRDSPHELLSLLCACGPGWNTPLSDGQRELLTFDVPRESLISGTAPTILISRQQLDSARYLLARHGHVESRSCQAARQLRWLSTHPALRSEPGYEEAALNLTFIREGWSLCWHSKPSHGALLSAEGLHLRTTSLMDETNWTREAQHLSLLAQAASAAPLHQQLRAEHDLQAEQSLHSPTRWITHGEPARLGAFLPPLPGQINGESVLQILTCRPDLPSSLTGSAAHLSLWSLASGDSRSSYRGEHYLLTDLASMLTKRNLKQGLSPEAITQLISAQTPWLGMAGADFS